MFDLFDFKTRQAFEGKPFLSARNEYEYDCARARQRMLGTTGFSGPMGKGASSRRAIVPARGSWSAAAGPSFEHWQVACRRR